MKKFPILLVVLLLLSPAFHAQIQHEKSRGPAHQLSLHGSTSISQLLQKYPEIKQFQDHLLRIDRSITSKPVRETKQGLDSVIDQFKNSSGWQNYTTTAYSYDEKGNNIQDVIRKWSLDQEIWEPSKRYERVFNDHGKLTTETYYTWAEESQWEGYRKNEVAYNNDQQAILVLEFTWDKENNAWREWFKTENTYEGKLLKQLVFSKYVEDNWQNHSRVEYEYDGNDQKTRETMFMFQHESETWLKMSRADFSHDASGYLISTVGYSWEENNWIEQWKEEYAYNEMGKMTTMISSVFSENWEQFAKDEHIWDDHGNLLDFNYYDWDPFDSTWVHEIKSESSYNLQYMLSDLLLPFTLSVDYGKYCQNMLTNVQDWEWDEFSNEWEEYTQATFYYSQHEVTNVPSISNAFLMIYPNPATEFIQIDKDELHDDCDVEVYDLQGRKVLSSPVSGEKKLYVGFLDKGIYLVVISQEGKLLTNKIVIN
jgi:hypothetical protein